MKRKTLLLPLTAALFALSAHAGPSGPAPVPTNLRDAEVEINDLDRKLAEVDARKGNVNAVISVRERRALARSRAYARMARAGLLPVAGGFEAFLAHAMKVEGVRRSILLDLDGLKTARREAIDLNSQRDALAARRAVVAAQREALGRAQALIDEADERKRAFERAFLSPSRGSDHAAVYGAGISVVEAAPQAGFESQKGRLLMPLAGRTELRAGRRGGNGSSLDLLTSPGAAARAVYQGRVAFTGSYADYGNLILLDHGSGYFTLYGNLAQIDVRVGDDLAAGARVGSVAGEGKEAFLAFEVRHRNSTLDPKPWLGL